MNQIEIRTLLRHYWKQNFSAAEAARKIREVEGNDVVSDRVSQNWFKKFNQGQTDLQNKIRPGRPITVDSESIRKAVEANPSTSTRRLSEEFNISHTSVGRHLRAMGKVCRRCREVPHDLTENQAIRRLETCKKLLEYPHDNRFIHRIVTSDEKWIYFTNPDKQNQWLDIGQVAQPVPKRERFSKKVLLCVWWNYEGVIHFELTENNQVVDADLYCEQLDRMYDKLITKYPAFTNLKRALLQQDNARPHTAKKTLEKIKELDAFELMPHPAYSPDLAPSDYHLFRSMAHFLRGRKFNNSSEVENACQEFFSSKTKEWYRGGIQELATRWLQVIQANGLYFET